MQLHQLTTIHKAKSTKRIGRGGKRGTYSGHGGKGQTARSGRNFKPIIREVLKRYPKLRGYRNHVVGAQPAIVNLKTLEAKFQKGDVINPAVLIKLHVIARVSGRVPAVKILGTGEVSKAFTIGQCAVSKSAREKIEKAGGTIK